MSPPSAGPAPLTSCCPASSGRYHAALHRTVSRHVHGASYSVARRHCSRCEPPRPLQCSPVPRCPIPADTAIGNRRMPPAYSMSVAVTTAPHVVLPGTTPVGSGRHCGWQSSPACRPHRCGSTSPRRPVQCCPAPRWSVLADTAAGNHRRHAARIAVGRRHHSSPCSVAQQHAGRFWQTQRLAIVAGMPPASLWVAVTTAPRSVLPNTTLVGSGRHCGLPSPPSCYWQTLRLALAAVRLLADTAACPRRRQAIGRH